MLGSGRESTMATHGVMTKSPVALAKEAYAAGKKTLANYSAKRSRHDFTQPQLFAILVLRAFFRTDYRGIIEFLADFSDLRKVLELHKLPHYTTIQKAQQRMLKKGLLTFC